MRRKFLPILLLLLVSAVLSANIRSAAAQHQTFFIIDPCGGCKIGITNSTFTHIYPNGSSVSLENGQYFITAIQSQGYTFSHWDNTSGIAIQNKTSIITNITLSGTIASKLYAAFNSPVTTIQPIPILFVALMAASLPVLLRRARKPIVRV